MSNNFLSEICKQIATLRDSISKEGEVSENQSSLFMRDDNSEEVRKNLVSLISLHQEIKFLNIFVLKIDDEIIDLSNFGSAVAEIEALWITFDLTVKKEQLLNFSGFDRKSTLNNEMLFFSVSEFTKSCKTYLGLNSPLKKGVLSSSRRTRIQVYGLEKAFGGAHIAVLPPGFSLTSTSFERAENKLQLPNEAIIRKTVHFVTQDEVFPHPRSFELSWGDTGSNFAAPLIRHLSNHFMYVCQRTFILCQS